MSEFDLRYRKKSSCMNVCVIGWIFLFKKVHLLSYHQAGTGQHLSRDLAVSRDITVAPGSKNCSCLDLVMLSSPVSMTQGCFPIISDRNLTTAHCVVTVSDSAQDTDTGKCNVNELPKRILPFLILRIHRHYFYIWQQTEQQTMLKHECKLDPTIGCQDKY